MKTITDSKKIDEVLTRRVEKILPSKKGLEKLLKSGKKIRLYQGFDPTFSRLHLGHTVGMRKLMDFANLGHEVIFLFGTGTVLVGDPSERDKGRELITQKEIDHNIKDWKRQTNPIVDFNKVVIKQNGDWLTKLTIKDIIKIASNISAVQLFKRDNFQRRIKHGNTVWFHETMYPLLQGYDSVHLDVDLEIGATDQEFNMLVGRELQRKMNKREKFVLTVPMILGPDGKKMSKTSGNCVWLDDSAQDMFGKLMKLPDEQIAPYLELATNLPAEKINKLKQLHPMKAKKELAFAVVEEFHNREKAIKASQEFKQIFQKRQQPKSLQTFSIDRLPENPITITLLSLASGTAPSMSEAKRLAIQGGIKLDGKVISNIQIKLKIKKGSVLQVGKRKFRKYED